jgi:RNA polymerase sigma-70 factor (ECF subfamily)
VKIISFYKNERSLIQKAASGNGEAQEYLYDSFAPKMLGVCRQYIHDVHFAEDVMINGFVKAFKNLQNFRFEGSFEGWLRRIMTREAISYLRKKQFVVFDEELLEGKHIEIEVHDEPLDVERIQELIDALPEGYKMVFLLYAIEGYKHSEISEILHISEGTSKSQLFKARRLLQKEIRALEASDRGRILKSNKQG